ncbi:WD40-repeat-containing domain protein [Dipodascopsis uninucleata]
MSLKRDGLLAALPSTSKGASYHLSFDERTKRISYASNKSVYLRSVEKPSESTQFGAHTASTTVAKFAPTGYYVASGDLSGNVKVWDSSSTTEDPEIIKGSFPIISGKITDLAWDADSKRIIAVGDGKERFGHCFTFDSGNSVGEITGHSSVINAVDIRQVRPYRAATVSDDMSMVFYHGPPFRFSKAIRGEHSNFAQDIAFSSDGSYLVSVGADRKIVVYDGREGDAITSLKDAHAGSILCVTSGKTADDMPVFATAAADGRVKLWKYSDAKVVELHSWDVSADHQVGVVFTSSNTLLSISLSGDINYLSTESSTPLKTVYGHQKAITALKISKDGNFLYTGSYDGRVIRWNIATGDNELVIGDGHSNLVTGIVESGDSIFSAAWDDTLRKIESSSFTGSPLSIGSQPKAVSESKDHIVVITEENLFVYSKSFSVVSSIKAGNSVFTSVSAAFDGTVAVGSQDGSVHLYSLPDLKPIDVKINPARAAVAVVSFAPVTDSEGRLILAVGDSTGKIAVIDSKTGNIITSRWAFHNARVTTISWRSDGKYAATGSLDTNIYVYSVDMPNKNIKTMGAHKEGVSVIEWLDDDKLISAGSDACVKIWKVEVPK